MSDIHFASGVTLFQSGQFQKAAKAFHTVLKATPRHAQARHLLGLSCAQLGDWSAAVDHLRRAAEAAPQEGEIWRNFAIVALEAGNAALAQQAIAGYCRVAPKDAETANLLGAMAAERNLPDLAALAWQQYLSLVPGDADIWISLGAQFAAAREQEKAIAAFEQAAVLAPTQAAPHANIGMLLIDLKRYDAAEAALIRALDRQPDLLEAMKALGNCFVAQKRHDRALAIFRRVASLTQDAAEARQTYQAMRTAMAAMKRYDDALAHLMRDPTADPNDAEFLLEHARLMIFKKNYDAALADFDRLGQIPDKSNRVNGAIATLMISVATEKRSPNLIRSSMAALEGMIDQVLEIDEAWHALGNGAVALHEPTRARCYFDKALAINPNHSPSLASVGTLLMRDVDYAQAEYYLQRAIDIDSDNTFAHNNLSHCRTVQGYADDGIAALSAAIKADPDYWIAGSNQLFITHFSDCYSTADIFAMAKEWNRRLTPPTISFPPILAQGDADKCLRVGFISSDFRRHAVSFFFESLLQHRDRSQWQVILYSNTEIPDEISDRLASQADLWCECYPLNDTELAERIRQDNIDILFDLSGHTAGNRLPMFRLHPAPIRATWLGYFDTTGLDCMDYLIADPISVTPEMEVYFTEKILRMPHDFACYRPPAIAPEVASLPALQKDYVTFGSANQLGKLTDRVVATWAELLRRIPNARLILQTVNMQNMVVRQRVAQRFAAAGTPMDRLDLRGAAQQPQILQLYNDEIDIALDPFPCVGGTTTCEALWMGVPVITLLGDRFCGRHSATHMTTVGLTETIAHTTDEYLDIAVRMASDLPALAALRAGLRPRMAASPLVDAARFTADFEALLRQMWLEKRVS